MFDKRYLSHFDWVLLGIILLIMALGAINLYSASSTLTKGGGLFYLKQLNWYLISLVFMLFLLFIDYRWFYKWAPIIYILCVVSLVLVLFIGKEVGGGRRWLSLGFANVQPSEFAKLAIVIVLASYFYRRDPAEGYGFKDLVIPSLLVALPAGLIMEEPDLGTAGLLILIYISMLLLVRIRWPVLVSMAAGAVFSLPFVWANLKPYQRRRIEVFLRPELDPLGSGYHVIQSKIAVGSGGLLGKGYLSGTQSRLNFLPERHTDFAFSVFAEEWGFLGAVAVVSLYLLLLLRGLSIAARSKERFGSFLAFGIVAMVFWQAVINIAMVVGMMPVVGVPLPLFSYGGSSVLTTMIGIGLLLNIRMRRFMFQ
ncbi:rod shape-determining protein RodA [Thermosulfuriphilus sp.]